MNEPGDPSRLIVGEGVHGIDEDRLDSGFARVDAAVIENREEEALGFPRSGSGGDDRGLPEAEAVEGRALMAPRHEAKRNLGE